MCRFMFVYRLEEMTIEISGKAVDLQDARNKASRGIILHERAVLVEAWFDGHPIIISTVITG